MNKSPILVKKNKQTKNEWHDMSDFLGEIVSMQQEQEGNELSQLHWGAYQLRQQSCLQGYYFLYRMNGKAVLESYFSHLQR